MAAASPTKKTSEQELDQFNIAMRNSEPYQAFLKQEGLVDTGRGVSMNKDQRKRLAAQMGLAEGMEIDAGGNVDKKSSLWKNVAKIGIPAGMVAATILTGGAASPILGALKAGGSAIASGVGSAGSAVGSALGIGGGAGAATGAGAGAGIMDKIGGFGKLAGLVGSGLSGEAQRMGAERGGEMDYNIVRAGLEPGRSQENRAARGQAWKDLQRAEYMLSRQRPTEVPGYLKGTASDPNASYATPGGSRFRDTTEGERKGAEGMRTELLKRLEGGPELGAIPDYQKAGGMETGMGWAGTGLGLLGKLVGTGQTGGPMSERPRPVPTDDYLNPSYWD